MNAEQVLLCYVYENVRGDSSDNSTETFQYCHYAVNVSKRDMDPTLIQCAFEYIHIILLLHISPHTEASEKRA